MKRFSEFKKNIHISLFLFVVLVFAIVLRFYGINWDQNQHLHPDERFLTMVTQVLKWPKNIFDYLDPNISSLNPYNNGYGFYVYGTLPLLIVKVAATLIKVDNFDYNNITLIGRAISSFLDISVILIIFKISKKIFNEKVGILAGLLYAISVLPIQLSHFYAVDTYLVFFITLCFYQLIYIVERRGIWQHSFLLGLFFGLALATKISAILFLPIIFLGYFFLLIKTANSKKIITSILQLSKYFIIFLLASYLSLRFSDPNVFSNSNILDLKPNPIFVQNLKQLKSFDNPVNLFPPAIQWIKTIKIIFPLKNIIFWGLGLPLGIIAILGISYSVFKVLAFFKTLKQINKLTYQQICLLLTLSWILFLFFYQGVQFAKAMRYLYPIYPFLAIISANFLYQSTKYLKQKIIGKCTLLLFYSFTLLLFFIWPLSFIRIFSRSHSRVTASGWIYQNIPTGSTISCEHWDDCLPLPLDSKNSQLYYETESLELYNPDTQQKWEKINSQLDRIDYIILSSNRLWGSIPKVPEKYPITSKFYKDLFDERVLSSGHRFIKIAEFTSYPTVPIFNISIYDNSAEESFTVYDHPQVIIFKSISF